MFYTIRIRTLKIVKVKHKLLHFAVFFITMQHRNHTFLWYIGNKNNFLNHYFVNNYISRIRTIKNFMEFCSILGDILDAIVKFKNVKSIINISPAHKSFPKRISIVVNSKR